ncbi:hypothetical protein Ndes2526B_g00202 [Nannochloris sp. 'desiccata']|nr:putative Hydrolase acrC [Chlorella desiccata (nom. nud.)]
MDWIKFKIKSLAIQKAGNNLGKKTAADFLSQMQVSYDPTAHQILRTLSYIVSGAADFGEVLVATTKFADNIPFDELIVRWYDVWHELAQKTEKTAEESAAHGHLCSAASAYLRACEYHRQSGFFLRENLDDPRGLEAMKGVQKCFRDHISKAGLDIQPIEIPFEEENGRGKKFLFGYFARGAGATSPEEVRTTIIFPGGYDGCAEESWSSGGAQAVARGYNVILLDGPGQGATLFFNRMYMRADYDKVLDASIAWLARNKAKETSINHLAVLGRSFGGFLGAQMAAKTQIPLLAVALDPLQVDFAGAEKRFPFPPGALKLFKDKKFDEMDKIWLPALKEMPLVRFQIMSRAAVHGFSASPSLWLHSIMNEFSCVDDLENISCPVWTAMGENEKISMPGVEENCAKIKDLTIHRFSQAADGALGHCQAGASARFFEAMYNWMEEKAPARV